MFDVGFWELLFIMVLALLVLGPKRLPGVVNKVGGWAGKARYMARSLRVQIERELEADMAATPTRTKPTPAPAPAAKPTGPDEAPDAKLAETDATAAAETPASPGPSSEESADATDERGAKA